MKMTPWFTPPQAVLIVYDFIFPMSYIKKSELKKWIEKCIKMAVNGVWDFEAQKSASIHHKTGMWFPYFLTSEGRPMWFA